MEMIIFSLQEQDDLDFWKFFLFNLTFVFKTFRPPFNNNKMFDFDSDPFNSDTDR